MSPCFLSIPRPCAKKKKLAHIELINFRDYATDAHKSVDDSPYGGGNGMILRVDVLDRALIDVKVNLIVKIFIRSSSTRKDLPIRKNCETIGVV